jgi:hypothetical protein
MGCEMIFNETEIGVQTRREMRLSYPPQYLMDAERLRYLVSELSTRYGGFLHLHLIDPQSLEGFIKSVRYWVRRYPTFILNRRKIAVGWDHNTLDLALRMELNVNDSTGEIQ